MSELSPTLGSSRGAALVVESPEGIPLSFEISQVGDRVLAFLVDQLIVFGVIVGVVVVAKLFDLAFGTSGGMLDAVLGVLAYLWFMFYFALFEIVGRGRTPGKRAAGLRVIDLGGRALTARQLFTRNLSRLIETFVPIGVLLSLGDSNSGGWVTLLASVWLLILLLLPLFNRNRQRLGDFLANTIVVRAPRAMLASDLSTRRARRAEKGAEAESEVDEPEAFVYLFTTAELELYGIFELQTLEGILRTSDVAERTLADLRRTIWRKMSRPNPVGPIDDRRFLFDFYTQLRAHLEGRLLLGDRRERKKQGRL